MASNTLAPWAELVPDVARSLTADDLLALPEDLWSYELVAGRLVRMPPTGLEHRDVTVRLFRALDSFSESRSLGLVTLPDTGFRVNRPDQADTVLSPDIAFVSAEQMARLPAPGTPDRQRYLPLAPDLAVEVSSPDQYRPEMAQKALLYLAVGTKLVWVVWPGARQVDLWRPGADRLVATLAVTDLLDGLEVVPGLSYPVAQLFA